MTKVRGAQMHWALSVALLSVGGGGYLGGRAFSRSEPLRSELCGGVGAELDDLEDGGEGIVLASS